MPAYMPASSANNRATRYDSQKTSYYAAKCWLKITTVCPNRLFKECLQLTFILNA